MNEISNTKNQGIASRSAKPSFSTFMSTENVKNMINNVVGKNSDMFITSIVSAVSTNKDLQSCEQYSILSCALLGTSLNLSPSPQLGQYYLVPYRDNKSGTTRAQFILGYKGYIQLAIRSGMYRKLNVLAIKEGELIKYDPLNEEIEVNLIDDEIKRENAKTIGYYAMFEYTNGFRKAIYWSRAKMEKHASTYSKGYAAKKGYTFWEKDFDAMAFKTMLRHLISKWGIMSIDLQNALEVDNKVVVKDGEYIDVSNVEEDITSIKAEENKEDNEAFGEDMVNIDDDVAEVFN